MMDCRLSIVTLGVADLKVATDFYERCLGWRKTSASTNTISFFQLDNGMLLSLYGRSDLAKDANLPDTPTMKDNNNADTFSGVTLAQCYHSKQKVDDLFALLKQKNVKILKEPEEAFWGGYSGYFADPDNHVWEIAFNPFLKLHSTLAAKILWKHMMYELGTIKYPFKNTRRRKGIGQRYIYICISTGNATDNTQPKTNDILASSEPIQFHEEITMFSEHATEFHEMRHVILFLFEKENKASAESGIICFLGAHQDGHGGFINYRHPRHA